MGNREKQYEFDEGFVVDELKPELKKPRLYKVLLLNDDYTPMDFVVSILVDFFSMSREKAVRVMFQVHNSGKGLCGVFTRDIAETKVAQINECSRSHEYPLLCETEPCE